MGVRGQGPNGTIKPSRQLCPRIGRFVPAVSAVRMWRPAPFAFAACAAIPARKTTAVPTLRPLSGLDLNHGNLYDFFVHGIRRLKADPGIELKLKERKNVV